MPDAASMSAATTTRAFPELPDGQLFQALRTAGDAEREWIQDALVRRYDPLVRWLARRYANRWVELDELRQVGYVGLVLAIRRFDPDRGVDFACFAKPTVQGEIRRHFRDKRRWIQLPRRIQELKALLAATTEELTHQLGRAPTATELARRLDLEEDTVLEALTAEDTFALTSLDQPVGDRPDDASLGESLGAAEHRFDLIVDFAALRPLIAALPPREQQILHMRFFEDRTQVEIGAEFGISQMHVSRLLSRTLAHLREHMAAFAA